MKLLLKGLFFALLASLFFCIGITAGAESASVYTVREARGEYLLYMADASVDEPILKDSSLSNLIERAIGGLDAKSFYFSSKALRHLRRLFLQQLLRQPRLFRL